MMPAGMNAMSSNDSNVSFSPELLLEQGDEPSIEKKPKSKKHKKDKRSSKSGKTKGNEPGFRRQDSMLDSLRDESSLSILHDETAVESSLGEFYNDSSSDFRSSSRNMGNNSYNDSSSNTRSFVWNHPGDSSRSHLYDGSDAPLESPRSPNSKKHKTKSGKKKDKKQKKKKHKLKKDLVTEKLTNTPSAPRFSLENTHRRKKGPKPMSYVSFEPMWKSAPSKLDLKPEDLEDLISMLDDGDAVVHKDTNSPQETIETTLWASAPEMQVPPNIFKMPDFAESPVSEGHNNPLQFFEAATAAFQQSRHDDDLALDDEPVMVSEDQHDDYLAPLDHDDEDHDMKETNNDVVSNDGAVGDIQELYEELSTPIKPPAAAVHPFSSPKFLWNSPDSHGMDVVDNRDSDLFPMAPVIATKKSLMDEFIGFAEASTGGSCGSIGNMSLTDLDLGNDGDVVSKEVLVSYLLSMGVPKENAEAIVTKFSTQYPTALSSHASTASSSRLTNSKPPSHRGNIQRAATTGKLDVTGTHVNIPSNKSTTSLRDMVSSDVPNKSSTSLRDMVSSDLAALQMSSRRRVAYERAEEPGAVVMQGRAYGAPVRPPVVESNDRIEGPREDGKPSITIEALPFSQDEDFVYAEKMSCLSLLKQSHVRRAVAVSIILVGAIIGAVCYVILSQAGGEEASLVPSASPTLISNDVLSAAIELSGVDSFLDTSPQYRAVAWMSGIDETDHEDFSEAFAQRYALVVLFYSTNGPDWFEVENWLDPGSHECDWSSGLSCQEDVADRNRVVSGLDLTRNGLVGTIPGELALLTDLDYILLSRNQIEGTLPPSIFNLGRITRIDLSSNFMNGVIPSELGQAFPLSELSLAQNQFSGLIPSQLSGLSQLRSLDLHSNLISGTFPEAVQQLTLLASLDIRMNLISGEFPGNLGLFERLDYLYMDHNQLTGTMPDFDTAFINLIEISASHNFLTGTLPPVDSTNLQQILSQSRIQTIDISHNLLAGTIDAAYSFLPTLRSLDLSGNLFDGKFPTQFGWNAAEYLVMADNFFNGTIGTNFNPQKLNFFDFAGNQLTGTIPTDLCLFTNLEFLQLCRNQLQGAIPDCVVNLQRLRALEMSDAMLTGSIPTSLGQFRDLSILNLANNSLTGRIPTSIGQLQQLTEIYLPDNQLTGTLPSELGRLPSLRTMEFARNSFISGTIPSEFSGLRNLYNATFIGNSLTGDIVLCEIDSIELTTEMIGCDLECSCCTPDSDGICG